jgi:hypothetical protein
MSMNAMLRQQSRQATDGEVIGLPCVGSPICSLSFVHRFDLGNIRINGSRFDWNMEFNGPSLV